jgi:hypothetical protein
MSVSARNAWRQIIDDAKAVAAQPHGEWIRHPILPHEHLFPDRCQSARAMLDAFLAARRAVYFAVDPEVRALYAPALKATADALEALMDRARDRAAQEAGAWS